MDGEEARAELELFLDGVRGIVARCWVSVQDNSFAVPVLDLIYLSIGCEVKVAEALRSLFPGVLFVLLPYSIKLNFKPEPDPFSSKIYQRMELEILQHLFCSFLLPMSACLVWGDLARRF